MHTHLSLSHSHILNHSQTQLITNTVLIHYQLITIQISSRGENVHFIEFTLKAFIMAVTIVVVAVPEGLPLAVTLSLGDVRRTILYTPYTYIPYTYLTRVSSILHSKDDE